MQVVFLTAKWIILITMVPKKKIIPTTNLFDEQNWRSRI